MQDKHLFEYAVIRVVPRVEREEFLNVGVILYCGTQKFLKAVYQLNEEKLLAFSPHIDIDELREYFCAIERICTGGAGAGPIGKLIIAERFRWLTATRSTIIQTSKVHTGLCADAAETLTSRYADQVL
jgi:hypothetical protein